MSVAETILDAVDILVDKKISGLQFNKTIRGRIAEITDSSIGKYKVQYQNSYFTAYSSDSNAIYQRGSEVYVEILSNDFEKNALIIGTVQRLGSNYISVVEKLDKYTEVGQKFIYNGSISTSSYAENLNQILYDSSKNACAWKTEASDTVLTKAQFINAFTQAAAAADSIKLGLTIENHLDLGQRTAGNFGLQIDAQYYNDRYVDKANNILDRTYVFDLNQMTGQPYKYIVPVKQYGIFTIDAANFAGIKSIKIFKKDFNNKDSEKAKINDIFFTNIHFQFLKSLTTEELQSSSLKILTPMGAYFDNTDNNSSVRTLKAELKIKGKKVNYKTQTIDFYWFRQNHNINSSSTKFSQYGGTGWEWLNTTLTNNVNTYNIEKSLCLNNKTKFKCVAVYNDNGTVVSNSDIILIENLNSLHNLKITSSAGTVFSFNTGTTVLTVSGMQSAAAGTKYTYRWTKSLEGEPFTEVKVEKNLTAITSSYTPEINDPAAQFIIFECTVSQGQTLIGTASITIHNNKENNGCTLVIRDGTQIFKYDTYGTSPASSAVATADRMTIPVLSFDIYDKQGNLINIANSNKSKFMTIKWIWPAEYINGNNEEKYQTMLVPVTELSTVSKVDLLTGGSALSYGVTGDCPTFTYSIRNVYNADLANTDATKNNIRLEVDYQGEHLVATTNFTFTKEGELGTNGTKYVARIVPKSNYNDIFIDSAGRMFGLKITDSSATLTTLSTNKQIIIANVFEAQLWDGRQDLIKSSTVTWSIAKSSSRTNNSRLTINNQDITKIDIATSGIGSNILQANIKYDGKLFYATYPILYINKDTAANNIKIPYIQNGYREVMYESDGSRGKFTGLPFRAALITTNNTTGTKGKLTFPINGFIWDSSSDSGFGSAITVENTAYNEVTIEPPSYFIGEKNNNYITLENTNKTYLPIELYLNRYGMSAMNDWDGNSIQVDKNGEKYILAPQIGAGRKENDNSFTGITIGEVFSANSKEIGMFGYYQGARSLFLDAETGDAEFGVATEGQIKIRASDGQGTISDGHYHYNHEKQYDPANPDPDAGRGLKIKFTSTAPDPNDVNDEQGPYIKYGSGNFSVDANGHLTARGGGSIAGWEINDNNLYSSNGLLYLNSSGEDNSPKIYGQTNKNNKHNSLSNTNNGFYLASDGLSIGSKFKVTEDGIVTVGNGAVSNGAKTHWTIDAGKTGESYIGYNITPKEDGTITLGSNNSVYIGTDRMALGSQFYVSKNGVMRVGYGAVAQTTGAKYWNITANTNENRSYIANGTSAKAVDITGTDTNLGGSNNSVYLGTDGIRLGKKFGVDSNGNVKADNLYAAGSGVIGGFNIGPTSLYATTKKLTLLDEGAILGPNLHYYGYVNALPSRKTIRDKNNQIIGTYLDGRCEFFNDFNNIRYTTINFDAENGITTSANNQRFRYGLAYYRIKAINTGKKNDKNQVLYRHTYEILTDSEMNELAFSPHQCKWEITSDGIAYFTDVKIRNTTGADNSLKWTNGNNENIFTLTDTGSQIGNWSISNNELSSGDIHITSGVSGSEDNTVISVNEALKIYGNGNLNTNGSLNASGGGTIGGASFGSGTNGTVNFPAGIMEFGGVTVVAAETPIPTSVSYWLTESDAADVTVDLSKVSVDLSNVSITGGASGSIGALGGTWSVSGSNFSLNGSGSLSGTAKVEGVKKYTLGGSGLAVKTTVLRTAQGTPYQWSVGTSNPGTPAV